MRWVPGILLIGIIFLADGTQTPVWAQSAGSTSATVTAAETTSPNDPTRLSVPAQGQNGQPIASSASAAATDPATAPATPNTPATTDRSAAGSDARAAANEPAPLSSLFPTAPGLRITGAVSAWGRGFFEKPQWDGQRDTGIWPNVEGWVRAEYSWNGGNDRINFMPYGRKDFFGSRSLIDAKEGYFLHVGDGWNVLVGVNTLHWGVTESRHLVNVVNQVDYGWNIDGDEVLGQPMANVSFTTPVGTLSLYGLFGFRPVREPQAEDRLRFAFVMADPTVLANDVDRNVNFAGRFSNTFPIFSGSVDLGISYFHGIGREPRYVLTGLPTPANPVPQITPFYDKIDQGGLDVIATFDALQLKFEGIVRSELGETYEATVAGFEYTFFNVFASGSDVGLVAEHLTDNRSSLQPQTYYAHDVFLGGRLTLNNSANTHFLGGILYNYDNQAKYLTGKFITRVRDDLSLAIDARYFIDAPITDALYSVLHDSYVQAKITKYF